MRVEVKAGQQEGFVEAGGGHSWPAEGGCKGWLRSRLASRMGLLRLVEVYACQKEGAVRGLQ